MNSQVMHLIFKLLIPRDLISCASVCRDWYATSLADILWEPHLKRILQIFPSLQDNSYKLTEKIERARTKKKPRYDRVQLVGVGELVTKHHRRPAGLWSIYMRLTVSPKSPSWHKHSMFDVCVRAHFMLENGLKTAFVQHSPYMVVVYDSDDADSPLYLLKTTIMDNGSTFIQFSPSGAETKYQMDTETQRAFYLPFNSALQTGQLSAEAWYFFKSYI